MTVKPTPTQKQKMFREWLRVEAKKSKRKPAIKTASLKRKIKEELERYQTDDGIKDYTIYLKWLEVQEGVKKYSQEELEEVYNRIWIPKGISDYRRLQPELIEIRTLSYEAVGFFGEKYNLRIAEQDKLNRHWNILRTFVSSQTHDGTFGKSIRFLVRDKISQRYLGVICVSNDTLGTGPRDRSIGITNKQWAKGGLNIYSINASSLIPTQPFGNQYLGGKLLALLALSKPVIDAWKRKYDVELISVTTTSLWRNIKGNISQYDGMEKYWNNLGNTLGSSPLKPSNPIYKLMREWMRENFEYDYWFHFIAKDKKGMNLQRDNKNRAINFCMKKLGFGKDFFVSNHQRGIYFARLYENTDAFYRGEITREELIPKFPNSVAELTDYWRYGTRGDVYNKNEKQTYKDAMTKGRIDRMLMKDRFNKNTKPDWYVDDAKLTFVEMKKKRLKDVGR